MSAPPPHPSVDLTKVVLALERSRMARRAARHKSGPGVLEELRKARREIVEILGKINATEAD